MRRNEDGSITMLALAIAFGVALVMVIVIEFCYILTVRSHLQGTMDSTLETTVEYWTMDNYRRDEELIISEEAAMDNFRDMLQDALGIDRDGYKVDEKGNLVWKYEEVQFKCRDNGIWVKAKVTIWPLLLRNILGDMGTELELETRAYINYNK